MKINCILLFLLLFCPAALRAGQCTIVISLDGFRWDYPQWYNTPFLDSVAAHGVESGLIPSFPSKTFPNHYAIATGLYPDHHGIVANSFYDPEMRQQFSLGDSAQKFNPAFYGGEPIWITAQRNKLHTTVFYWPGSDVKVDGVYPDKYYSYDKLPRLTFGQRVDGIINEMSKPASRRPQLIMAYFEDPDAEGHVFGPQSPITQAAVEKMDSLLGIMYQRMRKLPVFKQTNLIILSDHGMTWVPASHNIPLKSHLKPNWYKQINGNVPANIYAQPGYSDSIYNALQNVPHLRVWKTGSVPTYLHYGTNKREGDVIACPDLGYFADDRPNKACGNHGYDPSYQDMHAIFRAIGPDFKHVKLKHFSNTEVYDLLCKLLSITPAKNDGTGTVINEMLK